ncbi:hypothetical protein D0T53_05580 [Dysgonomonas sp. 216]|uniref:polysaccharide biosynthesis/export family protein n=1 Tax=Dysgonomonas sp. 216 TaxID=2302934 RepID=UPI0013D7D388|nr:polysaccharide biosynthesis/export family protein [Dysgonomonas sp. 216]NDW18387.1 hypothetical protein [Dysgonomonas sp. 216]
MNRKYLKNILLFLGVFVVLHSCISPKQSNLLQPNHEPFYVPKLFEDYRLQANDEIYCTILTSNTEFAKTFNGILTSSESLSATENNFGQQQNAYIVYDNGNVSIPFFGDIKVLGLTLRDAELAIQRVMRKSTPDAQVRVSLKNNLFYVVSDKQNGVYAVYKDNMTIYQAIAISGNPSEEVDFSKIKIVRMTENGQSVVKEFDLRTESVIESEYYYIKPNDVLYYSTSKGSFFKVKSFTSLITTIITPITFLVTMLAIDIK